MRRELTEHIECGSGRRKGGPTVFIQTADRASHIQAVTSASEKKRKEKDLRVQTVDNNDPLGSKAKCNVELSITFPIDIV